MAIAVTNGTGPDGTAPPGSSGITVLVVGCGFGGIATAIECHRKGHKVVVFEKNAEIGGLGEFPSMSAILTCRGHSGHLAERLSPHSQVGQWAST